MATLDVISELVQGSPSTPAREVIQGEQFTLSGSLRRTADGPDLDLADYNIDVTVEFYLASVSAAGDSLSIGSFVRSELADRTLSVRVTGADAFTVVVPSDLYTEEIAPAITVDVPVGVAFIRVEHDVTGETDIGRLVLVFRRGLTA